MNDLPKGFAASAADYHANRPKSEIILPPKTKRPVNINKPPVSDMGLPADDNERPAELPMLEEDAPLPAEAPGGQGATRKGNRSGRRKADTQAVAALPDDIVTEDNVTIQFAKLYDGVLRFCHDTGAWFKFDGNLWQQNRTGLAFQWARELARGISKDEPDKTRFITSKTSFASGVERYARSDPTFATTIDFWDQDTFLLGTPKGTVDLKSGQLREGRPEDGITKSAAIARTRDSRRLPAMAAFPRRDDGRRRRDDPLHSTMVRLLAHG